MGHPARWAGIFLLAGGLSATAGCMGFVNPVPSAPKELTEPCRCLPQACRSHVYIFMVGGADPCHWANLGGVCDYLHSFGFTKTYCGECYHLWYFKHEIKKIHQEDPDAHFVLLGFSMGALVVRELAHSAGDAGIPIDLLVYCGGNTLKNRPEDRPANALKIVNVLVSSGFIWNGDTLEGADNAEVSGGWHFSSPTNPYTVNALLRELAVIASRVEVVTPSDPTPPQEDAPRPRPLSQAEPTTKRDEWDFLKPVQQLQHLEPEDGSTTAGSVNQQISQKPARPVWIRGQVAPGEQHHQVARPDQ
jgi:hypothetical protein